ncbi:DUF814 domain protein [Aspergillus luchuensis]|uniref:DUF814 domain protein n=1 Tax=Aspergillus kawachii TaxID=1069201 RepID=A0A146FGE1_ASPKA|nr:DUF814 domain protein [Aspergillus luchuensis]
MLKGITPDSTRKQNDQSLDPAVSCGRYTYPPLIML